MPVVTAAPSECKRLIYGLVDPTTATLRYIGRSTRGLKRPLEHLRDGNRHKPTYLYRWINSLTKAGVRPTIVVIVFAPDATDEELVQLEIGWIKFFRSMGCRLTNLTDGGDGMLSPTPELRQRLREAHLGQKPSQRSIEVARARWSSAGHPMHNPISRAKVIASKIGRPRPDMVGDRSPTKRPDVRTRISAGRKGKGLGKQAPEHIERRAAKLRGRKRTPAAIEAFRIGRLTKRKPACKRGHALIGHNALFDPHGRRRCRECRRINRLIRLGRLKETQ